MNKNGISVIIPTWKSGDYLYENLQHLSRQTLDASEFEVIVVLNGERDPYHELIEGWLEDIPSVNSKLLYADQAGVSNARNIGLEASSGEFVLFVDDDDFLSPSFLSRLMEKSPPLDGLVVGQFKAFSTEGADVPVDYITRCYDRCRKMNAYSVVKFRGFLSSSCGKLIPRQVIDEVRFNTKFRLGEDSVFMFEISKNIKAIKLANEDAVYFRREHSASARKRLGGANLSEAAAQWFRNALEYTKIYLKSPVRYNVFFFMTRLLAVSKVFIHRMGLYGNKMN
jgi:glycosyltransferase involved in cell wall biosynthesis